MMNLHSSVVPTKLTSTLLLTCSKALRTSDCDGFAKAKKRIKWDVLPLPCTTVPTTSSNGTTTGDFPTWRGVEEAYKITDQGVSVPKILTLLSSDGTKTKLLVKGKVGLWWIWSATHTTKVLRTPDRSTMYQPPNYLNTRILQHRI
jgi:hypothetical protein